MADSITPEGARTIHGLARPNLPRNSAAVWAAAFMDFRPNGIPPRSSFACFEDGVDIGKFINENVANVPGIVCSLTTLTFKAF
ncbi:MULTISPECIES: hypothetical protein [unclassified Mesorhizobium]|uniref:hypothetical protein n=1 Tax=unclassified Mesorhizobium TaxID=325217 RepID=UPI0032AE9EF5